MNDSELRAGVVQQLADGIRRLVAPNPGMMTGPGTNTYLVGEKEIAVIDPGPKVRAHLDAIQATADGSIRYILVTHTHPDHSPAARVLAAETGAELLGRPPPEEVSALVGGAFFGAECHYLLGLERKGVPVRQALRRVGDLIRIAEGGSSKR
jgi:glyoxylase-like metal-dependent hydrolase (beta-lactamase superfamily II)